MMREWLIGLIRDAVRAEVETLVIASALHSSILHQVESDTEDIREVLTEASRIKALRDAGKDEPEKRFPVRQRSFTGIAARRAKAEAESLISGAHKQVVHNNDVRAMEGK
jgi:hypothetical protein